jgi:hypothetical protein
MHACPAHAIATSLAPCRLVRSPVTSARTSDPSSRTASYLSPPLDHSPVTQAPRAPDRSPPVSVGRLSVGARGKLSTTTTTRACPSAGTCARIRFPHRRALADGRGRRDRGARHGTATFKAPACRAPCLRAPRVGEQRKSTLAFFPVDDDDDDD